MRILEPIAEPGAPLGRRNPTAKLAGSALLTFILLTSIDPVTPAVAIALELALVPLFGIRYPRLLRRGWPLVASALAVFVCTVLFTTQGGGSLLVRAGPLDVTTGSLSAALGLALRIFAVALPGLLVFATTDPTDLADSLVQQVRVPARFAIG